MATSTILQPTSLSTLPSLVLTRGGRVYLVSKLGLSTLPSLVLTLRRYKRVLLPILDVLSTLPSLVLTLLSSTLSLSSFPVAFNPS